MRWGIFLSRLNRDTHWKGGGNDDAGTGQPVEADASVLARDKGDGMECPGKGRRGTRWHRGDGKKRGGRFFMVAAVLLFSAARNGHWQFLQIQDRFFMGLMG